MPETIETFPEYGQVRDEEQLDWRRLSEYLRGKLDGADRPMEVLQFRGGHSNLTYLLRFDGQEWVLRRPPFGPLPVGGHDMGREYRVLSRLWQAFPPAPRAMLFCEDQSIIGAPFFVMERRKGIILQSRQPTPPELGNDPATFRRICAGFIDTLADLHAVDYAAIGLGAFGKPEGFLQRQIAGWMARWEKAKTREVPLMEKLGAWLSEHMPPAQSPTLIHNDYFLHNVMFDRADPGRVAGIFDWEMSTIGDPLIDVGVLLNYWREPTDPDATASAPATAAHTVTPGFMSRAELIERYKAKTGRDLSHIAFYWAWAHWKNATVMEQIYARYVRGQTSDPRFALMGGQAPALAAAAARVAGQLGFRE